MWKGNRSSPSADREARLAHAERIGRPLKADPGFENHPRVKAFYEEPQTQAAMALLREQATTVTEKGRFGLGTKEVEREIAVAHVLSTPVGNSLFLSEHGLLMRNEMDMGLSESERFYRVPGAESAEKIDFNAVRESVRQFLAGRGAGVGHVPDDFDPEG